MTLEVDGGFAHVPGLFRPIEIDGSWLAGDDETQFRTLCEAARAVAPTKGAGRAAAIPDGRRYRFMIEIDGARHEVNVADPVDEPAIARLIEFVERHRA